MRGVSPFRKRQRGNAIIETALILIPFLTILFAIVDFNLFIFVRNTMQHAVREGVRYAVTYQVKSGMGHDASIKSVVQSNSLGFLKGATGASKISIKYYRQSDLTEVAANTPGNIIEVKVNDYRWGWIAQWFQRTKTTGITVAAFDRMESLPTGGTAPTR
jgi:Flp pilus assembly protein TadG